MTPRIFDERIKITDIIRCGCITQRSLLFIGLLYTSNHVGEYQGQQFSFKPSTLMLHIPAN